MSDAIREAFEALYFVAQAEDAISCLHQSKFRESIAAIEAALQSSQTAPAVPDGLDLELIVNALGDYERVLTNGELDGTGHHLPSDIELQGHLLSLLVGTPQPDHSPDAGKVVDECRRVLDRLNSSDPDFDDCADAAALIVRLQSELSGPDGFATWKDAALHERKMRLSTDAGKVVQDFIADQEPLGAEFEAVYDENQEGLYEFDDAHSADAGKVVGDHYDLGVALSRHFDELRDSETGRIAFDPCDSNDIDEVLAIINAHLSPTPAADGGEVEVNRVANAILQAWKKAEPDHSITKHPISYIATFADMARAAIAATHPAESREEIQVQALDGVWDKLYDMADERSASDPEEASGIMTAVNFIKGEAAHLRASQQEGEDNDK